MWLSVSQGTAFIFVPHLLLSGAIFLLLVGHCFVRLAQVVHNRTEMLSTRNHSHAEDFQPTTLASFFSFNSECIVLASQQNMKKLVGMLKKRTQLGMLFVLANKVLLPTRLPTPDSSLLG